MANVISTNVNRATDANGNPVAGAKAYFYLSGTSTPVAVYSDAAATTPHATPVVADGGGVFPQIYAASGASLKVNVTTASGAAVPGYPRDPVVIFADTTVGASAISFTPVTGNPATNVQAAIANAQADIVAIQTGIGSPSAFAKTLLDDASAVAMRTTLELDLATIEAAGANNAAKSGFWRLQNTCVNLPASGTFDCIVTTPNGTDISQTATNAVTGASYRRVRTGGAWTAWVRLVDASNVDATVPRIGVGQTWQNVTASRAVSTSYQNATGMPIEVSITGIEGAANNGRNLQVSQDNATWIIAARVGGNNNTASSGSVIIPPGWYYRLDGSMLSIISWAELR